jgi:hypothetical protein
MTRCIVVLAFLAGLISPALPAGTINLSLSQQFDSLGKPLSGCKLYLYQAGTVSTPQNAYSDTALTLVLPNPITCDSAGRIGQFFLADGTIKIRLTSRLGVVQIAADNLLVVGASSGGGGGGSIDATTILATGDVKTRYGTGALSGFVRANGRTIGSATSGATERANADTQALFEYLWNADANLSVSTGRGGSAAADWAANKTITLPDARGRVLASLDDMGNTAAGRLTATYFGAAATTLGVARDGQSATLSTTNLPAYTPSGTNVSTLTTVSSVAVFATVANVAPTITGYGGGGGTNLITAGSVTFTGTPQGGVSTPFSILPPMLLVTNYLKL